MPRRTPNKAYFSGLSRFDAILTHPRTQHGRDRDRAVGLLVVFEDGEQGARHGHGGAVEGVDEAGALLLGRLVADVEPAGLGIGAVGRAGHFAILAALTAAWH